VKQKLIDELYTRLTRSVEDFLGGVGQRSQSRQLNAEEMAASGCKPRVAVLVAKYHNRLRKERFEIQQHHGPSELEGASVAHGHGVMKATLIWQVL
jgi:hypothetical protein